MMRPVKFALVLLALLSGCSDGPLQNVTLFEKPLPENSPATKPSGPSPVAQWTPRPCPPDQVNFVVMGDWGADNQRQKQVAATLASYMGGSTTPFNAVLTVGDNFYVSLKSVNDANWKKVFEDMYDASKIAVPFYAALGNHDDGNKIRLEMAYGTAYPDSRWKMPGRWYRLDLPEAIPLVTVLVLDTDRASMSKEEWAKQLAWIDGELTRPRAKWTICTGHHPLFSNGGHGDSSTLQKELGELFRKHRVDFYLCGHDHGLQHLKLSDWPTEFIISGGGGAPRKDMSHNDRGPFSRKLYGFVHMEIREDAVRMKYIDGLTSEVVHEFVRKSGGDMAILRTTPSDVPGQATATPGNKRSAPIAQAIKAGGDDYQQMEKVLMLSAAELARFREARKKRDAAYQAWLATSAGKRYTQVGADLEAARSAGDSDKLKDLEAQYSKAREEQEALRRDIRREFNATALTEPQRERWAGHMLYHGVIGKFADAGLSDEQKQEAYAICVVLASQAITPAVIEKDPYLKPDAELLARAEKAVDEYVLAEEQRGKTD
ncbi:MAG: metallophosphoesterase [Tepidisphaerales bacterium]